MPRPLLLALCWPLAVLAADLAPVATLAPMPQAPVLDGRLAPGEWDCAVATVGFQKLVNWEGFRLDARLGSARFGFTADALYIAVESEMPPDGKLYDHHRNRDSDVIFDEGIELWLDPNRAGRPKAEGDLSFYQLITNASGTIYDARFNPKQGAPDVGWNGRWRLANQVDPATHRWTAELSLPFADLGWKPGEALGRTLGVLIARNYKNPWQQATWFPVRGAFVDWFRYCALTLGADLPCVQIHSLGEGLFQGRPELRATLRNPGPARQARVKLLVTSADMPELKDELVTTLAPGAVVPYAWAAPRDFLKPGSDCLLQLTVDSVDGKERWLGWEVPWGKAPERKWEVRLGPDPDAALRAAWYPSLKLLRLRLDPRELGGAAAMAQTAQVTVDGPDGKAVAQQTVRLDTLPKEPELTIAAPADGVYQARVAIDGVAAPLVRTFEQRTFPWQGNKLGLTARIYPPFEPVSVNAREVGVVGRTMRLGALGLWDGVKSLDQELLAGPMVLRADGQALGGSGRVTLARPHQLVYEGRATTPAVALSTRCTLEYDGCQRVELTLAPGTAKAPLGSLVLDIPLKDDAAPLWHVCTTGLRVNPAGATPRGEGVVWDSRRFPDGNWYGNFKPYLWLGSVERGLCWFADNDAGWVLDVENERGESAPCLTLLRAGGVLTLRVNLVQKPVTLDAPRRIVFGLMAGPGKPMRPGWRRIGLTESSVFTMNYGSDATYCAKYPRRGDWTLVDKMQEQRLGGQFDQDAWLAGWARRNLPDEMPPKLRERYVGLAKTVINHCKGDWFSLYFEEFSATSQVHPEAHVYQSEWSGGWLSKLLDDVREEGHQMAGIGTGAVAPSYRDFAVWQAAEWIRRGVGVYFDNAFPMRAYDPLTTAAYRLPDGRIQPSAGMWARRDYLQRVWVLHQQLAPAATKPLMMVHMTNTHILPYMVFNESNLDLEWMFGPEPQQSKYPADMLQAQTSGRQTGNVPLVIAKVENTKTPAEARLAHRSRFGAMMVHEVRFWGPEAFQHLINKLTDFGYGRDDCLVRNYWQPDYPLTASNPQVKSLWLQRGSEVLVLLCTWNPQPEAVTLTVDPKLAGLTPQSASDVESGETLPVAGGKVLLAIEGYGVRMVRLK